MEFIAECESQNEIVVAQQSSIMASNQNATSSHRQMVAKKGSQVFLHLTIAILVAILQ